MPSQDVLDKQLLIVLVSACTSTPILWVAADVGFVLFLWCVSIPSARFVFDRCGCTPIKCALLDGYHPAHMCTDVPHFWARLGHLAGIDEHSKTEGSGVYGAE